MIKQIVQAAVLTMVALALSGCVRSQVARTDERTAYISAHGSAFNSDLDVYQRVIQDAAKATLDAGYDFFVIEDSVNTGRAGVVVLPGQSYTTASATVNGNTAYGTAETTYSPAQAVPIFKPGQDVRIHFLKASEVTPAMTGAKDAHWIIAHAAK